MYSVWVMDAHTTEELSGAWLPCPISCPFSSIGWSLPILRSHNRMAWVRSVEIHMKVQLCTRLFELSASSLWCGHV